MKAKHSSKSSLFKKLIIIFFIVLIIFTILFFIKKLKHKNENSISSKGNNNTENSSIENIDTVDIPDTIDTYTVLGKIVIEKVEIEQYIIKENTTESQELGAIKFYGPGLNQPGNLCLAGHNYPELFGPLANLEINDTFYIIDKENSKKVTYKIYDKYTVYPDNLDCLNQETNDKREVTLITCTPGNLTRLILKAKEI